MRNVLAGFCALVLLPMGCGERESTAAAKPDTARQQTAATTAPPPATQSQPTTGSASARAAEADRALEQKLLGTWVADDVDAKLGSVKIRLTFRKEGPMKLAAWSDIPLVGQVRDKTAPYEVHGDVISSEAIRGGTTVKYWFDGGDLIINYRDGKTVRFHSK